ncbi:hypothetical protein [Geodermatophilus sp. DSM 45219]|uniref:hypothetical protein n=1 Tax=Geodermatophilus sp. DSM 45219 TaxID=1881103 RepID=UPI0008813035|nr:hypothetical protein [Geodermatophilus sp. DSM 45219]SDN68410.1 hypothetical protein SAMN05428965_1135 [Geodermatophilus sp. DSM 45219]
MITRRPVVLSSAATVVLATSGCAFLTDLAEPDPPAAASTPVPTGLPRLPPEPVEVAAAALADRHDGLDSTGTVRVAVSPVDGLPPLPGSFAADGALADDGSVRTTAVEVAFADTTGTAMAALAATVALTSADGGEPAPDAAVFVESSAPDTRWCQDGTTTPTVDGFWTSGVDVPVTAYVVAPAGVPAADLVLRVSGLRNEAGSNAEGPWDRVTVWSGGCADDPAALCAPLG